MSGTEYRPISAEWLRENGYDGLVNPGECGCRLVDGIRPCGYVPRHEGDDCAPAHETGCTRCGNGNCHPDDSDTDAWCMVPGLRWAGEQR